MDLSNIKANTVEKELFIPGVGGTGFYLELRFESAPEVQAITKKFENKLMQEAQKGKRADKQSIMEWYKKERMVAHIAGWRWSDGSNYNGEQPDFSPETARKFIDSKDDFGYFLRDFINEQVGDAEDFLEDSVTS